MLVAPLLGTCVECSGSDVVSQIVGVYHRLGRPGPLSKFSVTIDSRCSTSPPSHRLPGSPSHVDLGCGQDGQANVADLSLDTVSEGCSAPSGRGI